MAVECTTILILYNTNQTTCPNVRLHHAIDYFTAVVLARLRLLLNDLLHRNYSAISVMFSVPIWLDGDGRVAFRIL
jgi:hypothetical protein